MDDPRSDAGHLQEATRWLLVVLVGASVLAAGVLAVSDVPGLIGRRWQVVGVVSAAVTVLALLVGLLAVLRAMGPGGEDDATGTNDAPEAPVTPAPPPSVPVSRGGTNPGADEDTAVEGEEDGTSTEVPSGAVPAEAVALVLPAAAPGAVSRRSHRHAVRRYHRARAIVTVVIVVAALGMTGMTTASVVDGNNVEARTRGQLEAQLSAEEDGPITEPRAVTVQLTTPGLRRVAAAMGCTGAAIGSRPVQGWAVSGTFRNPTVVLFAPVPACNNTELLLEPRDGFVYPSWPTPVTSTTRPVPTSVAETTPASTAAAQAPGPADALSTPTPAAP